MNEMSPSVQGNERDVPIGTRSVQCTKSVSLKLAHLEQIPPLDEDLTELDLMGNYLTSLKGIERLGKLSHLNLSENELTSLKGIENLTNFVYIDLSGNEDLTSLEELDKLPRLEIVIVDYIQYSKSRDFFQRLAKQGVQILNANGEPASLGYE